jgi:ABC-type transporter Mla subunit MlaD
VQPVSGADRLKALLFLVVGLVLVLGTASFLTGYPFKRAARTYFVDFTESITGIDAGSDVQYRGVKKGKVWRISIVDGLSIRLVITVQEDTPVDASTFARISSVGILGPWFIELYGSIAKAEPLPEGSVIPSDTSTMKRLMDAGIGGINHLNELVDSLKKWSSDENRERIERLLDTMNHALDNVDASLTELRPELLRLSKSYADLGVELREGVIENRESFKHLVADAAATAAALRRFIEAGRLDAAAEHANELMETSKTEIRATGTALRTYLDENRIAPLLERATASIERLETAASSALRSFEGETASLARDDLGPALRSLREAARALQELASTLRNDPSLLLFSSPRGEATPPRPGGRK